VDLAFDPSPDNDSRPFSFFHGIADDFPGSRPSAAFAMAIAGAVFLSSPLNSALVLFPLFTFLRKGLSEFFLSFAFGCSVPFPSECLRTCFCDADDFPWPKWDVAPTI